MEFVFEPNGEGRCIYSDYISIRELGDVRIQRVSHVEPNSHGEWVADLSPIEGPKLGPFLKRTDALTAEVEWLREHWLTLAKA